MSVTNKATNSLRVPEALIVHANNIESLLNEWLCYVGKLVNVGSISMAKNIAKLRTYNIEMTPLGGLPSSVVAAHL